MQLERADGPAIRLLSMVRSYTNTISASGSLSPGGRETERGGRLALPLLHSLLGSLFGEDKRGNRKQRLFQLFPRVQTWFRHHALPSAVRELECCGLAFTLTLSLSHRGRGDFSL